MAEDDNSILKQMLSREEDRIEWFSRRLFLVEAVQKELSEVSRDKPFRIWNDVIWMMLLDTRDAFVIHFASWVRSMNEKGGFLRQIQAHHIRKLRRQRKATLEADERWLHALLAHHHHESFARLFPEVKTAFPQAEDVRKARSIFFDQLCPIIGDRDSKRAHPYEAENEKNAAMLDLGVQRELLENAQRFLNDLRIVACNSSFHYSNANIASVKQVAEELVDQILIRKHSGREVARRDRKKFYAKMHEEHDSSTLDDPQLLFNDAQPEH